VVATVLYWSRRTQLPQTQWVAWIGISRSKFYEWRRRRGKPNEHNGHVPRDFWLLAWERQAILDYRATYHDVGYRRMAYQMLDEGVVAVSPASVYRVLASADAPCSSARRPGGPGKGFSQPDGLHHLHHHWYIDVSRVNVAGALYELCSVIDGFSRYIVAWDLRERMTERDVEVIRQRARDAFPAASPKVMRAKGHAFVAADFKELIRLAGISQGHTSTEYPQSNGRMERWLATAKDASYQGAPLTLQEVRRIIRHVVARYNDHRLHSALGYVPPVAVLEDNAEAIFTERRRRLDAAARARAAAWTEGAEPAAAL